MMAGWIAFISGTINRAIFAVLNSLLLDYPTDLKSCREYALIKACVLCFLLGHLFHLTWLNHLLLHAHIPGKLLDFLYQLPSVCTCCLFSICGDLLSLQVWVDERHLTLPAPTFSRRHKGIYILIIRLFLLWRKA